MNNIFQRDLINRDLIRHDGRPLDMDQPNPSQETEVKKNVIVLIDQESRHSQFLRNNLGMSVNAPFLCRTVVPTRVYNYEIFGLSTHDPKLDRFIHSMDGIIVIFELENYHSGIHTRLSNLIRDNPRVPIMTIIERPEYIDKGYYISDEYRQLSNLFAGSEHRKLYVLDVTQKTPDISGWIQSDKAKNWFNNILTNPPSSQPPPSQPPSSQPPSSQPPPSQPPSSQPPPSQPPQSQQPSHYPLPSRSPSSPQWTSHTIDISTMVRKFMDLSLDLHLWDHYGRLRIVHYSLTNYGYQNTINPQGWLCTHWKRYKASIGHGHLWHYTLTRFWATLLSRIINTQHHSTFNKLYRNNPFLHQGKLFQQYYTPKLLFTNKARNTWVPPDLRKL